jgi:hypothetical protein
VGFLLAVLLVCGILHECSELTVIGKLQLDEPSIGFGRAVDKSRLVTQSLIDFEDGTSYRSIYIGCSLYGFNTSERITPLEFITNFWEVHKDNVTKGSLGKVGDSDCSDTSLNLDVLVGWKKENMLE